MAGTPVFVTAALVMIGSALRVPPTSAPACRDGNLFVVAGPVADNHHRELANALRDSRLAGVYTSGTSATGRAAHRLSDEFGLSLVPYDRDLDGHPITRRLLDEVISPHRDKVLLIVLDSDLVAPLLRAVARDSSLASTSSAGLDAYFAVSYAHGRTTVDRCPTT